MRELAGVADGANVQDKPTVAPMMARKTQLAMKTAKNNKDRKVNFKFTHLAAW